ncbi:MAG: Holliday junction branch migration protein RuvA [Clostridiaceae bacterium]|nr:Holliday junction branch migration protein RuvA [Clostridiaceae bacterium]
MFEYIKGTVSEILIDKIIVEVGGIGYRINSSINSAANVEVGDTVTVFTHFVVREDEVSLYGFITRDELTMFKHLISVSKVGPKVGGAILSTYTPRKLAGHILNKDTTSISKAPGVGKKTAERIVLELKDKVKGYEIDVIEDEIVVHMPSSEVIDALMALGYTRVEAEGSVNLIKPAGKSTEEIIKEALKLLMK